jgi:hypothetical protein
MRRILLLGAAAVSALLAVAWARGGGGAGAPSLPSRANASPAHPPLASEDRSPAADPNRNPFEYAPQERPKAPALTEPRERRPAPPPTVSAPPVVLVGLVHRGPDLLAAVSILGEVVVLAPGESSSGYTLVAVDEDLGARLRGPSGDEFSARPSP